MVESSPVVKDGNVYFGSSDGALYCLNADDGSLIWKYHVGSYRFLDDVTSSVIDNEGTIYFAYTAYSSNIGYICALTPEGDLKWKTRLTSDKYPVEEIYLHSAPSIGSDGTVYITSYFDGGEPTDNSWGYLHAIGGLIQQPRGGYFYLFGKEIFPTYEGRTIIIGPIDIQIGLFKEDIEEVEFYINGLLKSTDITSPFNWTWDIRNPIRHRHTIEVIAYDKDGEWARDRITVWKFL